MISPEHAIALGRIADKYARQGRERQFTDVTRVEFLRAFSLVPTEILGDVITELMLNPPSANWIPEPSDVVIVARRMSDTGQQTPTSILAEINTQIREEGWCGSPKLSAAAWQVVEAYGGWEKLCSTPIDDGVFQSLILRSAKETLESAARRPVIGVDWAKIGADRSELTRIGGR